MYNLLSNKTKIKITILLYFLFALPFFLKASDKKESLQKNYFYFVIDLFKWSAKSQAKIGDTEDREEIYFKYSENEYKNLAKEALGIGDKILHENYLQHSDHYARILSEVNKRNIPQETPKTDSNKLTE